MSEYPTQLSDILETNQPGNDLLQRTDGFGIIGDDEDERSDEPLKPDRADSGISGSAGSTPEPELRLNLEQHNLQQENYDIFDPQPAKSLKKESKPEPAYFSDVSPGGQESKSRLKPRIKSVSRIKKDDGKDGLWRNEREIRSADESDYCTELSSGNSTVQHKPFNISVPKSRNKMETILQTSNTKQTKYKNRTKTTSSEKSRKPELFHDAKQIEKERKKMFQKKRLKTRDKDPGLEQSIPAPWEIVPPDLKPVPWKLPPIPPLNLGLEDKDAINLDQRTRTGDEMDEDDDIFEAENLPDYAKTYALPRRMTRRKSQDISIRRKSSVSSEFQLSMLKTSLSFDPGIAGKEENNERGIPRRRKKSLVPCYAAGGIKEYTEYVKEGNFVPGPILDPELAMDYEIFSRRDTRCSGESDLPRSKPEKRISLSQACTDISVLLNSIEETYKESEKKDKLDKKRKPANDFYQKELEQGKFADLLMFGVGSSDSSGYQSTSLLGSEDDLYSGEGRGGGGGADLLDLLDEEEKTPRFQSSFSKPEILGDNALDMFIDRLNPYNRQAHPALPNVMKQLDDVRKKRADKMKLQEELFRVRTQRREAEGRRENLVGRARVLQARANKHKSKLSGMWEEKLREELTKTGPLEQVCSALREELDEQHKKRLESFEIKMKPIIIRDGPSQKANYKISAAKIQYDIFAISQRLRHTSLRCEHEEKRREMVEREVRLLRDKISDLKIQISTITKGIPMSKIELRDDKKPGGAKPDSNPTPAAKLSTSLNTSFSPGPKPSLAYLKSQQATATQILHEQKPIQSTS
ncbi:uncharacterized protein LOC111708668 isoform X2 [Eurytemora carolleeae]|uniref:uncharacterized protein LOC111708668 isoform X2 n=1 Tax=Eurytemora carolleeae TaxID=1294199 RepID=UPI000C789553|nr:uncharacterized protein LOC111708668 isoform X2 [Eurytemora carolleeae]|eukprot:XP_023337885.1 uncharacterized protein LOC111708668 isoform X2 [Eurytemora affinis]